MVNLRLLEIKVLDSISIEASFTEDLDPFINIGNVSISSNVVGVPDPAIQQIVITDNIINITTLPMTPYVKYQITFQSTNLIKFKSLSGNSFLLEDGATNIQTILGAENPADPIRDFLLGYLKDSIYNTDPGTMVRDIINSQSGNISRALYDVRQIKNDNYLSVTVLDELKTRSKGPFDRLNEEGAYELIRVGKAITGTNKAGSISFDDFPSGPITLQQYLIVEEQLTAGYGVGNFNGLILTTTNQFVTKLKEVKIIYNNGNEFDYNISTLGYRIKNPRYDQDFASTLLILEDNQFKLSDEVLEDPNFIVPAAGDTIIIDYEYKLKGRVIDETSVMVSQVLDVIRENTPPLLTQFTLSHFPIVNSTDSIFTSDGVVFLDPNSNLPFTDTHPAFLKELPFKFDGLPSRIGEYCVDYNTGRVFVFGAVTNDGTGDFPPTVTYKYRNIFSSRLDYTYDPNSLELVANPIRDLATQILKISFNYEDTLVPGIDFIPQIHTEILDERIQNRLLTASSIGVLNTPITNVFRVYNETSGEIYKIQRFNDNTVFFTPRIPPNIVSTIRERALFTSITDETLLINNQNLNALNTNVLTIPLQNNKIISSSEDVIGSSFNSSVYFSRTDIFQKELYFDSQTFTLTENINRLHIGQYQIDYQNGIVYLGASNSQTPDLGTVNYKNHSISPINPHVISVTEVYNSINTLLGINKHISYLSFSENSIIPSIFDISDERFIDNDITLPYIVENGTITVVDDIKDVRGIYDHYDLTNNIVPTNFADRITITANVITLQQPGIKKQEILTVQSGSLLTTSFISSGIEMGSVISIIRLRDNAQLSTLNFSGYTINLDVTASPVVGDVVLVVYELTMNASATPIVDYNRGDYFIDYDYLADEILVSYEYGDNSLDFRQSSSLNEGDQYFVSYKVGALRDALLKNFGSLVDIPILNNFDTTLPRENYREALTSALQSFTKGPTIPAMKSLVSIITHIDPEIIEAAFQSWSLGISNLYPNPIDITGDIQLLSAKFDNGALIANSDETITFPVSNNLRLEGGTLETWVIPEWDGLDNDATLTLQINKNNSVLSSNNIWIGADSHHPIYDLNNKFTINRKDASSPIGLPSAVFTKTGMFIYYDNIYKLWKILAKELVISGSGYTYSGTIQSSGEVYNVKNIPNLGEIDDILRSSLNDIAFEFHLDGYDLLNIDGYVDGYQDGYLTNDGYVPGAFFDGIEFMADDEHYFFDFGQDESTNRFSLFKDGRGYLNFRIFDKGDKRTKRKSSYKVSSDISSWKAGQKHHLACSWKLNTANRRDELHLFIDGFEVPNILKYGGRPIAAATDRFRTVKPEIIAGTITKNSITDINLTTTLGSNVVYSPTINFTSAGILVGDVIEVFESGFSTYNIVAVTGNYLTLDTVMPNSLTDAKFSVNPFSAIVTSEIDLYNNITISRINSGVEIEIPGVRAVIPGYSISKNMLNQNILTILGDVFAGDQIAIRTLGLNHRRCRDRKYIWGNTQSILKTQLPPPINLDEVKITAVLLPSYSVGPANSSLVAGIYMTSGISTSQPSNSIDGRTLTVQMTGNNVNFTTPATVTIFGTTAAGPTSEIISFPAAGNKITSNKFKTITSVSVTAKPIISSLPTVSVEIKEAYSIIYSEGNELYPVIRFSYKTQTGITLQGTGSNVITDNSGYFTTSSIGQTLVINTPSSVAGTYTIVSKIDNENVTISPTPSTSFSNGSYDIFNTSLGRSGFQNGFFTFEQAGQTNVPFTLNSGFFDFDYSIYLEIPLSPLNDVQAYIGSDLNGGKQAKSVIDEFVILSRPLTDVRVGETISAKQESITTDFTRLISQKSNSDTLMLVHFNSLPFVNEADFWVSSDGAFLQSDDSVNANFEKSLVISERPLVIDNAGLFSTNSEGTIEFWISPRYDTYNDPNFRFYFDASGSAIEESISISNGDVKTIGKISSILSIRLQTDVQNTGINYAAGSTISADFQTIKLGQALPYQQTPIKINYIPSGLSGDRISLYKDKEGYIVFNVTSKGIDYQVRQPIFWSRDTWHRIRATYKFNRADNLDEIRLFVDGEERGTILFGQGLLFGQATFGQGFSGINNSILIKDINFNDPINQFFIGSDYLGINLAQARIDNFRLSNISRSPFTVAGQAQDVNFSSNVDIVYPVIPDSFTTYLLDFNTLKIKTSDLTLLRDKRFGIFNFTLNIIDSFDIVMNNPKIKQILEALIAALKPAQSRATINYIS